MLVVSSLFGVIVTLVLCDSSAAYRLHECIPNDNSFIQLIHANDMYATINSSTWWCFRYFDDGYKFTLGDRLYERDLISVQYHWFEREPLINMRLTYDWELGHCIDMFRRKTNEVISIDGYKSVMKNSSKYSMTATMDKPHSISLTNLFTFRKFTGYPLKVVAETKKYRLIYYFHNSLMEFVDLTSQYKFYINCEYLFYYEKGGRRFEREIFTTTKMRGTFNSSGSNGTISFMKPAEGSILFDDIKIYVINRTVVCQNSEAEIQWVRSTYNEDDFWLSYAGQKVYLEPGVRIKITNEKEMLLVTYETFAGMINDDNTFFSATLEDDESLRLYFTHRWKREDLYEYIS